MGVKIDSVGWGEIAIGGEKFFQAMVIGGKVVPRDHEKLERSFGTTHVIPDWEQEKLLEGDPEVVVIGDGWSSCLKVSEEARKKFEAAGVEVLILDTTRAVKEYNRLVGEGKKVNVLIHTTC
jgi:hypothetical protein